MTVNEDDKAAGAFRTIGEVASSTGVATHVLRYWETRFPQLRPVTRAGNRRYYRPADVALVERIKRLLNTEGYTVKGVQKLLAAEGRGAQAPAAAPVQHDAVVADRAPLASDARETLIDVRDRLQRALDTY